VQVLRLPSREARRDLRDAQDLVLEERNAEVGYNRWVRGRSARRYNEPYFSISRNF
jgi:hypothetical protein